MHEVTRNKPVFTHFSSYSESDTYPRVDKTVRVTMQGCCVCTSEHQCQVGYLKFTQEQVPHPSLLPSAGFCWVTSTWLAPQPGPEPPERQPHVDIDDTHGTPIHLAWLLLFADILFVSVSAQVQYRRPSSSLFTPVVSCVFPPLP